VEWEFAAVDGGGGIGERAGVVGVIGVLGRGMRMRMRADLCADRAGG
jgi:hypothetical protein